MAKSSVQIILGMNIPPERILECVRRMVERYVLPDLGGPWNVRKIKNTLKIRVNIGFRRFPEIGPKRRFERLAWRPRQLQIRLICPCLVGLFFEDWWNSLVGLCRSSV